jgi:hypothetical protein
MAEAPGGAAPQPQPPADWQQDLQRTLSYIVPLLSAELRITFMEFVKSLKAKRDAREIPSLSAALMEQAPQVVGADLWQQCIDRQREEAAQPAEAPAGPTDDGAAPQQERNADAAGPPPRGKNLVKVADALKKRALEERDEADANAEKKHKTLAAIAKQYICPITLQLPTEPVKAEDGHTYERKAIEGWLAQNATSPVTRAHMGTRLMEDYAAKNTIEELVNSGDIDDELATAWKQKLAEKLADETLVKETRALAKGGDGEAMYCLGTWYGTGLNGLAKDDVQARAWLEQSAATRHPQGMAMFSSYLLLGIGGSKETSLGLVNVTEAAGLGSDMGAFLLGKAFFNGTSGLPKDPTRARYWLKKVVDDECKIKHLSSNARADAAVWLHELDGGDEALYARLQRRHEEHQRRQREATALRE